MKLWLADLTYTQQTIASDTIPAGVGMIGAYVRKCMPEVTEVKLFKYPEALAKAFEYDAPDVMGFSNYVWNASLSNRMAMAVRKHCPKTVIIMGGPNFPTDPGEQEEMLRTQLCTDFFIMKEAELAFLKLLQELQKHKMDLEAFTEAQPNLPNLVYIDKQNQFHTTTRVERVLQLADLPSPYLNGDLDEFFDGKLLPIIQTNRGCPFACTFCTEGQTYWSKVNNKPAQVISGELRYIAEKVAAIAKESRRSDLLIADSNFGMYASDLATCGVIAEIQKEYDYPRYINVATGKNQKERVLQAAKLVDGAMKLAGSVQSLDTTVMQNIKRANISAEQIVEMAVKSAEIGTNTYGEVILALPGDTLSAHFKTLQTLINSGFNTLSMYQLMILPGTELGSKATKEKYGMTNKFRVVPRCFGYFKFRGETIISAEIEEICVSNQTLPYEDYLACRRMNLTVNVFFNDGVFAELMRLLKVLKLSPWEWMLHIYETHYSARYDELMRKFFEETEREVFSKREELEKFTQEVAVIDRYISGEYGSNLIFKYKALSMTEYLPDVTEVSALSIDSFLASKRVSQDWRDLAQEIVTYNFLRAKDLFSPQSSDQEAVFRYDVIRFAKDWEIGAIEDYRFSQPTKIHFEVTPTQRTEIAGYVSIFGDTTTGLTRILTRVYLKKFFRTASHSLASESQEDFFWRESGPALEHLVQGAVRRPSA